MFVSPQWRRGDFRRDCSITHRESQWRRRLDQFSGLGMCSEHDDSVFAVVELQGVRGVSEYNPVPSLRSEACRSAVRRKLGDDGMKSGAGRAPSESGVLGEVEGRGNDSSRPKPGIRGSEMAAMKRPLVACGRLRNGGSRLRWAKEGIDDLDQSASFCVGAAPRRSTSSLATAIARCQP